MADLKFGIALWSQQTDWSSFEAAARSIDRLGYDTLFTDDHLYADTGAMDQPKFEAWTSIAAFAPITGRVRLGHFVLANTFRNPGLVVKSAVTVDHISNGRAILGVGAGWFKPEHDAFGLDFGAGFARLDWMDEGVGIMRALLDGETVTHNGPHYQTSALKINPLPIQRRLPIMIGGAGEKKTLRTVARYADMWHAYTRPVDEMRQKLDVLATHCATAGRDPADIELTLTPAMMVIRNDAREAKRAYEAALLRNHVDPSAHLGRREGFFGPPEALAERIRPFLQLGFTHIIADLPSPFDQETIERLIGEVGPLLRGE